MTCSLNKPKGFKILKSGASLKVTPTVQDIAVNGASLKVTKTDGSSFDLTLPKAEPANVQSINILNASGTQTVATVATLD